jgi:hypothetical protein
MAILISSERNVAPKSTHVSDSALQPFLQPTFDPADYLNATLPSLSLSSRPSKQNNSASLADLSTQTQDLLSQLNAHTTRLSTILTQLTDDILRSGGRLAYEVEVLRGETIGLRETLTDGLRGDIEKFLPGGLSLHDQPENQITKPLDEEDRTIANEVDGAEEPMDDLKQDITPEYITQLRTLTLVRARLESVIKIFGEAMHWTLPPSEVSITSSLISVSGPDPDSDTATLEKRGKDFAASLRSELSDLITGAEESNAGAEAAAVRIQALRDLAQVWRGTAEEKARAKFVDGLVKLVEEKQRERDNAWNQRQKVERRGSVARVPQQRSGGFLDNLQRIRGNIGLE